LCDLAIAIGGIYREKMKAPARTVLVVFSYINESDSRAHDKRLYCGATWSERGKGFQSSLTGNMSVVRSQSGMVIAKCAERNFAEFGITGKVAMSTADGASAVCHVTGPDKSANVRLMRESAICGWWGMAHRLHLGMGDCIAKFLRPVVTLVQELNTTFNGIRMGMSEGLVDCTDTFLEYLTVIERKDIGNLRRLGKYIAIRWSSFIGAVTRISRLMKPLTIVLHEANESSMLRRLRRAEPLLLFITDFGVYFTTVIVRMQYND
jgi:hypothetical protein